MSNSVVVRIERLNTLTKLRNQQKHDERKYTEKDRPDYIDVSKTHLNSILIPHKTIDEIKDYINKVRKAKKKLRSNAVLLWTGIIGFGTEAQQKINRLTREQQDKLFYKIVKAIADYMNVDIESISVHRDESAIHCHFSVYSFTKTGKSLSKSLSIRDFSKIQDIASETIKKFGINIERGKRKIDRIRDGEDYSKIIHRTVYQLHQDLPKELNQMRMKVDDTKVQLQRLAQERQLIEKQLQQERERYEKEKRVYQEHLLRLQNAVSQEQERIKFLQSERERLESYIQTQKERMENQTKKLERLQSDEKATQEKINQAKKTLSVYENRLLKAQNELKAIENQIQEKRKELEQMKERYDIQAMLKEIEELRKTVAIDDEYIYATAKYFQTTEPDIYEKLVKRFSWIPDFLQEIEYEKSQEREKTKQQKPNYPNLNR